MSAISRRDFLNGMAIGVTGAALAPELVAMLSAQTARPESDPSYYPPALTGMRGSHDGSWEVSHALRDGQSWASVGDEALTGETFDLIVVGGGLSGLAAAWFFRKSRGPESKILILDNHDDFGGHAKRNEFRSAGRLLVLNGGTLELEAPSHFSRVAADLVREIGIDIARFDAAHAREAGLYESMGLGRAMFFDKETFGEDRLVAGAGKLAWPEFLARTPLSEDARRDIARLYDDEANPDYMGGAASSDKKAKLARMSYRDYLLNVAKVGPEVVPFFQARTHDLFCLGIDAVPALYCWQMGYPGFQGLALDPTARDRLADQPGGQHGRQPDRDERSIHFPDGNATMARLIVRAMIPDAIPGRSMEDVQTARMAYNRLDDERSPVRIRLNSTVVHVEHVGEASSAHEVAVTYVQGGRPARVRGRACVLACWNTMIPHLCPELPQRQKEALAYGVKAPIVYTSVLVANWRPFVELGVSDIHAPGGFHNMTSLSEPVSLGDYRAPRTPDEPIVLHLVRTPCSPGLSKKDQHRMGRTDLLSTPFDTFERKIRDQLGRMLSGGGFDPGRDIQAITVNRWPHGYAYTYNTLFDPPEWALGAPDDRPCVIARKPFGRIAIANSDAAASPHTDAAIDMAYRAVEEVSGTGS